MKLRRLYWLLFLALLFLPTASFGRDSCKRVGMPDCFGSGLPQTSGPQQLTDEGEAELQASLRAGELLDLRWPNFENFQAEAKEFYKSFGRALPWVRWFKPTPQACAMIQLLKSAESKGLEPEDYDSARWDGRLARFEQASPLSESELIRFDVALTVSAMRYVSNLHAGRVDPRMLRFELDFSRKKLDLSEFLRQEVVDAQEINAAVEAVEPPFPAYRRTITALHTYLEFARRDVGQPLPVSRKVVEPGDSYTGVPRLTRLLELLGDLPRGNRKPRTKMIYEGSLVEAVKHFQQRHGLEPNGRIDAQTLKELNTPLSRRVVQLQLTLERWRWLPNQFDRPPIVVTIPEFRLHAINEEHHSVFSMKVVVGKAYQHQTPVFASEIPSVIFRPYWNVPLEIQQSELVPDIEKNPSYLRENSYEIVDSSGTVVAEGAMSDEMKDQIRSGQLAIRQKPGPANALGLIKFDLPNPYDIYLHGTPATELFAKSRRDFSHGCIRVEDPVGLAEWVLRDKPKWTTDQIRTVMYGDETIQVNLDKPIPVLIVYGTALVTEDGEVHFFEDIYGHDAALERVLAKGYPYFR